MIQNVCLAKDGYSTVISCPSPRSDYRIDKFAQNNQNFVALAYFSGNAGYASGDILTMVPIQDITACLYDNPNAIISGGWKPLIYSKDIHATDKITENLHYLDPTDTPFDEAAAFKCLCRLNFNLLDGCTVHIYDRGESYSAYWFDYWDSYTCKKGMTGDKTTTRKVFESDLDPTKIEKN